MGQVTIYLEDSIEQKMTEAAKSAHLSKSKWIAQVISERVKTEWPQSVADMAGSWSDFPSIDELRHSEANDAEREQF
ncbi:hypothetical protein [Alkalimarinus coralli]|uniref:hypothetical protein n=1 Tax=Alkalimarinus coralli TaxID=2935863 RepID=UPI00202B8881|nr:hypothetical protein [Alkalimarinus coralli]